MAKAAFTEHEMFLAVSKMVNAQFEAMAATLDCLDQLGEIEAHTGRVVDDMTKLLLRAHGLGKKSEKK